MRYTVILFMTTAIAAAVYAAPVTEGKAEAPRTRISANPDDLLAHENDAGAGAVNRHFVLNNEDNGQFIKIVEGAEGNIVQDVFTKD